MRPFRFVLLALVLLTAAPAAWGSVLAVDLSAHRVDITTGFTGTSVLLFGARSGNGDVVATLRGPSRPLVVRRKQRRLGVWLNRDQVRFEEAPGYYAVAANRPLAEIAEAELMARLGVGAGAVVHAAKGETAQEAARFRTALVRLMEDDGRYRELPGGISFIEGGLFRGTFELPANVPTGEYRMDVLLIDDGALLSKRTTKLQIGKSGVGAAMFAFAHSQPLLYGLVAAVVALMAGWAAAMLFGRR